MMCTETDSNRSLCFDGDVVVSQPTRWLASYEFESKVKTKGSHQMSTANVSQGVTDDIVLLIVTFSSINADLLIFIILTFLCQWEAYTYRRNVLPE